MSSGASAASAGAALPGTAKIAGFLPIVAPDAYIAPLALQGVPFAFLLTYPDADPARCTIRDVVVLPRPVAGESFLQCNLADDSSGFGIRKSNGETLAYWSVGNGALTRQPVHVIGAQYLTCAQPETGE